MIVQAVRGDIWDNLGQADLRPLTCTSVLSALLRVISEHCGTEC